MLTATNNVLAFYFGSFILAVLYEERIYES
jgi:hypothetical protein